MIHLGEIPIKSKTPFANHLSFRQNIPSFFAAYPLNGFLKKTKFLLPIILIPPKHAQLPHCQFLAQGIYKAQFPF